MTDGSLDIMKDNSGLTGRETRSGRERGKEGHEQRGFFFPTPELGVNQTGVRGGNCIRLGLSLFPVYVSFCPFFTLLHGGGLAGHSHGRRKTGCSVGVAS